MRTRLQPIILIGSLFLAAAGRAEMSADDLTTLAKKVRASVMFVLVSDDSGHVIASGTGFIVSADGKLITNRHVANAGPQVVARAPGGRQYRVLGALAEDSDQDLVVLQIEDSHLLPVTLGSSDNVSAGTPVLMVGNPLAMESTVQEGTVSGFRKFLDTRRWIEISAAIARGQQDINSHIIHGQGLQVTTAVAPGSSGSPVFNANGEVIGVVTAIERYEQSIALAIPVEAVKELITRAARASQPQPLGTLTRRGGNDLSTDIEYDAAAKAFNSTDYEKAEGHAKTVVARYPDSASAHLLLGQVYLQRKSNADAADSFERAIQLKHDLAPAWVGLALANSHQGLKDRAAEAVRELQKLDPALAKKLTDAYPALAR
jgi:S1-C subfamily serine protease